MLPAGGGGAAVLVGGSVYFDKMRKLVYDGITYGHVRHNPTTRIEKKVSKAVKHLYCKELSMIQG